MKTYIVERVTNILANETEHVEDFSEEEYGDNAERLAGLAARTVSRDGSTVDVFRNLGSGLSWEMRYRGGEVVSVGTLEDEYQDLADLLRAGEGAPEARGSGEGPPSSEADPLT